MNADDSDKEDEEPKRPDSDPEVYDLMADEAEDALPCLEQEELEDRAVFDQTAEVLTAYQNEQITDYFHWNDNEGLGKKSDDQLKFLHEIDLEQPRQVMLDELDRLEIVLDSSDEESETDCRITGTKPMQAKREMLYNLKKEIKVKSQHWEGPKEESTAWRTLTLNPKSESSCLAMKVEPQSQMTTTQASSTYDYFNYISGEKAVEPVANQAEIRDYLLSDRCVGEEKPPPAEEAVAKASEKALDISLR